jgi:hypothetical protein
VAEDGIYTLGSNRDINIDGYLYQNKFNPLDPSINQISRNVQGVCSGQLELIYYLRKQITYILLVTTYFLRTQGSFSIIVVGPSKTTLKYSGEYFFSSEMLRENVEYRTHS